MRRVVILRMLVLRMAGRSCPVHLGSTLLLLLRLLSLMLRVLFIHAYVMRSEMTRAGYLRDGRR